MYRYREILGGGNRMVTEAIFRMLKKLQNQEGKGR